MRSADLRNATQVYLGSSEAAVDLQPMIRFAALTDGPTAEE